MFEQYADLTIRNATVEDADLLSAWWNDGKIMAHAGFPNGTGETPQCIAEKISKDEDHVCRRLIIEYDNIPIGEMNYYDVGNDTAEIGIKICDFSKQDQGYGKILLSMLIRSLFSNYGYQKIILDTNLNNIRAQHVYERLGFKKVRVRNDSWKDQLGELQSSVDYELVEDNFNDFSKTTKRSGASGQCLPTESQAYRQMQLAAKKTIAYIKNRMKPGMKLLEIRKLCEEKLLESGADSFWYWDVGAFIFAGDETAVSVSGRQYVTADRVIGDNDIVTIDLSPQKGNIWGDYARTIVVENGNVVDDIERIQNPEWKSGLQMEEKMHAELLSFAAKDTTFEELYDHMNGYIVENGFVNLDFMGNLGHSIAKAKEDRIYIESGNMAKLGEVTYFTFEPHIAFPDSKYGYKKENIYYFDGDRLMEL